MALMHRSGPLTEWPVFRLPERWAWPFEGGDEQWLRVEEFRDGEVLVVRAELPDIDPDRDVEVTTEGGTVRIHAHREQRSETKGKEGFRSEFRYGDFDREIALPDGTRAEDVTATYRDGILEVRIPCPTEVPPSTTRVPVSRT